MDMHIPYNNILRPTRATNFFNNFQDSHNFQNFHQYLPSGLKKKEEVILSFFFAGLITPHCSFIGNIQPYHLKYNSYIILTWCKQLIIFLRLDLQILLFDMKTSPKQFLIGIPTKHMFLLKKT